MWHKRALIAVVCAMLFLSACTPRLIGEEKAKEAGLALINLAFDLQETEAKAALEERPGLSYINGIQAHLGDEKPIPYYTVKVGLQEDGNPLYYAEVNAATGVAYRAEKCLSTIVLTEEQQKQADALGTLEDFFTEDFSEVQQSSVRTVDGWVHDRLERDVPFLRTVPNIIESDSVSFPLVWMEYYVICVNGTIYNVTLCWPTMEVVGVYLLNRDS